MKSLISIIFIFVATYTISAQVTQEWVSTYIGPANSHNAAKSIAVDNYSNVYITGQSFFQNGSYYATLKYNSSGIQQWIALFNDGIDSSSNCPVSIALDSSGNVYVTGRSNDYEDTQDFQTIKYSSKGFELWAVRYDGPANLNDSPTSMKVDNSGNVYVTGFSYGNGTDQDIVTVKYNTNGIQQWVARYNGPFNLYDFAVSILVDNSGNVYVTGESFSNETTADYLTLKYNSEGIQLWTAIYNGKGNSADLPSLSTIDSSGNVYVTGQSRIGIFYDYNTVKYNSDGVLQWVSMYHGSNLDNNFANSIAVDASGNVIVTGKSYLNSMTHYNYCTVKYNTDGVQQWVSIFNGSGNWDDNAISIVLDASGNSYVTGYSYILNEYRNYTTIKYNTEGVQQWVANYNGMYNYDEKATSIALDKSNNVYVTGTCYTRTNTSYFATIKYSQLTGIEQTSSTIPEKFSLSQNYPNPFNPTTKINYELRVTNYVSLIVYDVLGNKVKTLVNEKQSAGTYEVEFDASSLPSGTYFYRLSANVFIETKKMLLLK